MFDIEEMIFNLMKNGSNGLKHVKTTTQVILLDLLAFLFKERNPRSTKDVTNLKTSQETNVPLRILQAVCVISQVPPKNLQKIQVMSFIFSGEAFLVDFKVLSLQGKFRLFPLGQQMLISGVLS